MRMILDLPNDLNRQIKLQRLKENYNNKEEFIIHVLEVYITKEEIEEDGIQKLQ